MEPIKEAFDKVKTDILSLKEEVKGIKFQLNELRDLLDEVLIIQEEKSVKKSHSEFESPGMRDLDYNSQFKYSLEESENESLTDSIEQNMKYPLENPTEGYEKPTNQQIIPTDPTHNPTDNYPFKPSKAQNMSISTGNGGVPTDKQTNQQTNQQTQKEVVSAEKKLFNKENTSIDNALEILSSLDSIKKEIRLKFKELTEQEFLVFSAIYQYDEEQGFSDYRSLSQKLSLSESSVRDYVGKLVKKGIPVQKEKINNKQIKLSISQNLKKIASLNAIVQLRDL